MCYRYYISTCFFVRKPLPPTSTRTDTLVHDTTLFRAINTRVASMAVSELLARLHPFRTRPNGDFAIQRISMSHGRIILRPDGEPDANLASHVGRGTTNPPLLLPRLGRPS